MKIIKVTVEQDLLDRAIIRANGLGVLKNSITRGGGNVAGMVAEEVIETLLIGCTSKNRCKDYDLVVSDDIRFDVKTKRTSVVPKPYYECSIAEISLHQQCDGYIFCRFNPKTNELYICGFKSKADYMDQATYLVEGDVVDDNNFDVKENCFNLPISELHTPLAMGPFTDKLLWEVIEI